MRDGTGLDSWRRLPYTVAMNKDIVLTRLVIELESLVEVAEAWTDLVKSRISKGEVTNEAASYWQMGIESDVEGVLESIYRQINRYRS